MADGSKGRFGSLSWYRKGAMILLIPFVLPGMLLVMLMLAGLGLLAVTVNCITAFRIEFRMWRLGRYLSLSNVRRRIAAQGGTLIVESPTLGWNITCAWWTPDNVLSISPFAMPTADDYREALRRKECLDWDKWCWENYISPEKGRAFLLRVWNGASMERKLRKRFPELAVVRTWTALVHVQKPPENAAAK